jgi:hypothetical protein
LIFCLLRSSFYLVVCVACLTLAGFDHLFTR